MPADPNRESALFHEASEITDPERRQRFLKSACGEDRTLLERLQNLLGAAEEGERFFRAEDSRQVSMGPSVRVGERPGDYIGRYRLLEQIGEGGFGVVFMAEQEQPVRRKVALKIIKLGMDTRQVIARFEAERQALAMMDHPNIARVLDAGATESGRPYFVMELVHGIPITSFCRQKKLRLRERLKLFEPVCKAIQSAHQKGIIHRDIKPTNILVTLHHGEPMPKVIDFGIAKAIDQKLTEKTLFTNFDQMLGTPAYMSPEQAAMSSANVDTRTDVYSLGILLYELLTGTTPFPEKELRRLAWADMQRVIREEEPARPSTMIRSRQLEDPMAMSRDLEPHLGRIYSELDWIVMKALDKNRERRYETADALSQDVTRFLKDEPVSAVAPTLAYQWRKLVRKHRKGMVVGMGFVGVLVLATILSTWQSVRTTRALALVQVEKDRADRQAKEAERQKAIAEAVNDYLTEDILGQGIVARMNSVATPDMSLREVIRRASDQIEGRFPDQPVVEASVRRVLGSSLHFAGEVEEAKRHLRAALEILHHEEGLEHERTLVAMRALGHCLSFHSIPRRSLEGEQLLEQSYRTSAQVLGETHSETLMTMVLLGFHYANNNDLAAAEPLFERGMELAPQADEKLRQSLSFRFQYGLAYVAERRGFLAKALKRYEDLLVDHRKHDGTNAYRFAEILWSVGDFKSIVERRHEEAAALIEEGLSATRPITGIGFPTLELVGELSLIRTRQGRLPEAIELRTEHVLGFAERLGPGHPRTTRSANNLARLLGQWGDWTTMAAALGDLKTRGIGNATTLAYEILAGHCAGDTDTTVAARRTLMEKWRKDPQGAATFEAALILLSLPSSESPLSDLVQMGKLALESVEKSGSWVDIKVPLLRGLVLFREKHYGEAIQALDSIKHKRSYWPLTALGRCFLAMAHHHKGNEAQARLEWREANQLVEDLLQRGELERESWNEILAAMGCALLARAEGEILIFGERIAEPVGVERLAALRAQWHSVRELLIQADQAGRRREYSQAAGAYRQAMGHERFNLAAGAVEFPDLDQRMAVTFVLDGDLARYNALAKMQQTEGPRMVTSRILAFVPEAPVPLQEMSPHTINPDKPAYWVLDRRGPFLYRAGRYQEALDELSLLTGWDNKRHLQGLGWAAMAAYRLGEHEQAEQFLARVEQGLQRRLDLNEGQFRSTWHEMAKVEMILQEARELMGKDAPSGEAPSSN